VGSRLAPAKPGDDLALAYRRLNAAYAQTLRYAEDVRRLYQGLQRAICQSLLGLANALEAKDPYTRGHSERVGVWSRRLAASLGVGQADVEIIAQAGLLHDIGKIGVPEAVLGKRGPLTSEEWGLMRRHPVVGAQIVAPFDFLAGATPVIRHHHERWDGSGYPDGLAGEAIPLGARLVAVADVYDALTSARPYRAALTPDAARQHLHAQAGRTLDARAVAVFIGLAGDRVGA
jgi:putative nucleotidyltransferase with HDIG domain